MLPEFLRRIAAGRAVFACLALLLACAGGCTLSSKEIPDDLGPGANDPLVRTALSQLGKPYRSGGDSPGEGFDCSGLVMWSYSKHGIKVPRTTGEQMRSGRAIGKENLRPGDIVCFQIGKGRHTGLYIDRNYFVHSPSPGKRVSVDSLSMKYWNKYYIGARRPTGR